MLTVTLFSPNPKIKPIQIEISDIQCWCECVAYYFHLKPITFTATFDTEAGTVTPDAEISPFAFININHKLTSLLLKEYYGYFSAITDLRKYHHISPEDLLPIEEDQLEIARQSNNKYLTTTEPDEMNRNRDIISTAGDGGDQSLLYRGRIIESSITLKFTV